MAWLCPCQGCKKAVKQEQERILKILDQFDTLVNDLKIGLPAEIKARRAQYEYYRKKLLTFKMVND